MNYIKSYFVILVLFFIIPIYSTKAGNSVRHGIEIPQYPELVSPANDSYTFTITPFLRWKSVVGAISYDLQISLDPNFSVIFFEKKDIDIDSCLITCLDFGTRYHWRVRSNNSEGSSEYSPTFSFISRYVGPDVVILSSPINELDNVKSPVTLKWEPYIGVVSYSVQVATDKNFSNKVIDSTITAHIICNLTLNLKENTTYYWRIGGCRPDGMNDWSQTWSFHAAVLEVEKVPNEIPAAFELNQNYPNPFNPETNIKYSVFEATFVSLKIFSSTGQELETLVNKNQSAGVYQITWRPVNIASGVYYYELKTDKFKMTKKMSVIK
jgi:hypothetical protein